eukprot:1359412-Rhodomonas_salina.1
MSRPDTGRGDWRSQCERQRGRRDLAGLPVCAALCFFAPFRSDSATSVGRLRKLPAAPSAGLSAAARRPCGSSARADGTQPS